MKPENLTIKDIFHLYDMKPLPVEGGWFTRPYLSEETIAKELLPERYPSEKPFGTAILYLLTPDPNCFSAMHVLPTDEIYHFYLGDPVEMLQLNPDSRSEVIYLGHDILAGQKVQYTARRGVWQGSHLKPGGSFALIGTTMAPGFTDDDYYGGERDELIAQYPDRAGLIHTLTRPDESRLRMV
ncbi:MAG: cupin domain-containing protein [Anaerolineales bacterium]|nr:cupin domain-containing protein [Anaerolineales bacterium]